MSGLSNAGFVAKEIKGNPSIELDDSSEINSTLE